MKFEKVGTNYGVETWYLTHGSTPNIIYGILHSQNGQHEWRIYAPLGKYKSGKCNSLATAKRRLLQERRKRGLSV